MRLTRGWRRWRWAVAVLLAPEAAWAQPYAFAVNAAAESVSVLNLADDTLVGSLPLPGRPTGAALGQGGKRLFVARTALDSLAMIDTATGAVTTVPVGYAPAAVALGHGWRVYVANTGDDTLSVVVPSSATVVATIPVGNAPVDVAAWGRRIYTANWGSGTVSVVDLRVGSVVAAVAVGKFPSALALDPASGRLYVASFIEDTVSVIDTTTLSVIATIPVTPRPRGMALDPAAGRLYVAGFADAQIDVIDTATNTVVLQAPSGGVNPTGLMLGPDAQRLYVSHLEAGQPLRVLDAVTLAPLLAIDAPTGPVALAGSGSQAPPVAPGPGRTGATLGPTVSSPGALAPLVSRRPRAPADAVIADTEFNPADWEAWGTFDELFSTSQEASGGNPGAWRRTIHEASGQGIESRHRFVGGVYDPWLQGPIGTIDASWDRRSDGDHMVFESMFLMQNGVEYRTSEDSFTNFGWMAKTRLGLTAADFNDSGNTHPDFSGQGAPITFGYRRSTAATNFDAEHGIDNFSVTVHVAGANAGLIGFRHTTLAWTSGEVSQAIVERGGGTLGTVGVTYNTTSERSECVPATGHLTWADGDGTPRFIPMECELPPPGSEVAAELVHLDPDPGSEVHPDHETVMVMISPPDWDPQLLSLWDVFKVFLASGFTPAWLALLALPAALLAARRRRSPGPSGDQDRS